MKRCPLPRQVFDPTFRKDFPNVERYFTTLVNQPEFKAVLGDVVLCKACATYTPGKPIAPGRLPSSHKPSCFPLAMRAPPSPVLPSHCSQGRP